MRTISHRIHTPEDPSGTWEHTPGVCRNGSSVGISRILTRSNAALAEKQKNNKWRSVSVFCWQTKKGRKNTDKILAKKMRQTQIMSFVLSVKVHDIRLLLLPFLVFVTGCCRISMRRSLTCIVNIKEFTFRENRAHNQVCCQHYMTAVTISEHIYPLKYFFLFQMQIFKLKIMVFRMYEGTKTTFGTISGGDAEFSEEFSHILFFWRISSRESADLLQPAVLCIEGEEAAGVTVMARKGRFPVSQLHHSQVCSGCCQNRNWCICLRYDGRVLAWLQTFSAKWRRQTLRLTPSPDVESMFYTDTWRNRHNL